MNMRHNFIEIPKKEYTSLVEVYFFRVTKNLLGIGNRNCVAAKREGHFYRCRFDSRSGTFFMCFVILEMAMIGFQNVNISMEVFYERN